MRPLPHVAAHVPGSSGADALRVRAYCSRAPGPIGHIIHIRVCRVEFVSPRILSPLNAARGTFPFFLRRRPGDSAIRLRHRPRGVRADRVEPAVEPVAVGFGLVPGHADDGEDRVVSLRIIPPGGLPALIALTP